MGYVAALIGVALTTCIIYVVPGADHTANISLLYLLVVIATAYLYDRGSAVLASVLAVLSFNWFFVDPRYTLTTYNPAEWLTFAIFLVTALMISQLTQNLRIRADEARNLERETAALSRASWAVASQVSHEESLSEVLRQMANVIPIEAAIIVRTSVSSRVEVIASHQDLSSALSESILCDDARFAKGQMQESLTLQADSQHIRSLDIKGKKTFIVPLGAENRILGLLFLQRSNDEPFSKPERRVLDSLANHAAVVLERHRLTQAEKQAQVLMEADKLKTALLSMVSHDFRSPLAAIKASVTSLLQDESPWEAATQRELLTAVDQETDRLNHMVGDVLALSRLEAGAWHPQRELISVSELVGATLDTFSQAENQRIEVNLEPNLPEVNIDTVQIVQLLHNLLENALKYSPSESVVELRVTKRDSNIRIEVCDRGFGLPEGEEQHIFERFYRATRWRETSVPGSGIGLALCRGFAEAHGGRLNALNRDGGGAIFEVSLPLPTNECSTPEPQSSSDSTYPSPT